MLTLSLRCFVLLYLPLVCGETDLVVGNSLSRETIIQAAAHLCQSQAICNISHTRVATEGCCDACSCDEGCIERNDCCFPDLDKTLQTCEQTSLNTNVLKPNHYYMITMCPSNTRTLHSNYRDCGNTNVSSWGSLHPVHSTKTGLIYKNRICAECHGVKDGILWEAQVSCPPDLLGMNTLPVFCNILFFLKEEFQNKLKSSKCGILCKGSMNFNLPRDLSGMTHQDIVQACNSGFYSQSLIAGSIYKNVFCQTCDGFYDPVSDCLSNDLNGPMMKFTWLLSHEYSSQSKLPTIKNFPLACKAPGRKVNIYSTYLDEQNDTECIRLYCPYSQIYGNGYRCYFPVIERNVDFYHVNLKLRLPKAINIPTLQTEEDLNKWLRSAWPKRWKIDSVNYQGIDYGERFEGRYLLIELNMYRRMRYKLVVGEVGKLIASSWDIQNGNETIKTLGAFNDFYIKRKPSLKASRQHSWIVVLRRDLNASEVNHTLDVKRLPISEVYEREGVGSRGLRSKLTISKVYYCPLVLVNVSLVTAQRIDMFIYKNILLSSLEVQQHESFGSYYICQDDSPYRYSHFSDAVVFKPLHFIIQMTLIIFSSIKVRLYNS